MITLNLQIPETVAAEFYQAADDINKRFRHIFPAEQRGSRGHARRRMAHAIQKRHCGRTPSIKIGRLEAFLLMQQTEHVHFVDDQEYDIRTRCRRGVS